MTIKTKNYPACDSCAYAICTGDESAIEDDDTVSNIENTLSAIKHENHAKGAYVLETTIDNGNTGYLDCMFCNEIHLGSQSIQIAEPDTSQEAPSGWRWVDTSVETAQ